MFDSLNDSVFSAIVLLASGISCVLLGKWLKLRLGLVALLAVWHTLLAIYYADYVLQYGGDAFAYYQKARFDFIELDLGTEFVEWLTSFPVALGLGFGPVSLLYNAIGTFGLLFFYAAVRETGAFSVESRIIRLAALLCLFVPSLSFWTSGIGKDSIAFFSVGLFLWSAMDIGRRQPAAIAAVLVMLAVRPHVAALMVLSVAAGTVFAAQVRGSVRFSAAAIGTAGAVFAIPLALAYSGTARFESITAYIADRQEQNLGGGSSIDITGMNPAARLLSYLYRPLPNEASGLDQVAASLDNLFLIALTLLGIVGIYRAGFIRVFRHHGIALLYGLSCLVLLSQVTANLGLATRQKWMLVPALMVAFLGAWTMAREERARKQPARRYLGESTQALR